MFKTLLVKSSEVSTKYQFFPFCMISLSHLQENQTTGIQILIASIADNPKESIFDGNKKTFDLFKLSIILFLSNNPKNLTLLSEEYFFSKKLKSSQTHQIKSFKFHTLVFNSS